MFIIAQMNADGGEAVRFVVARIRTASLPSRIRYTFTIHGVLSARRHLVVENEVMHPNELLKALKRYLEKSGETERAVASRIGINHHILRRWLSDEQSPKKGKLALTAFFLRGCLKSPDSVIFHRLCFPIPASKQLGRTLVRVP